MIERMRKVAARFVRCLSVGFGMFLDLFRREGGFIKRRIGNHVMYFHPRDKGISRTLRRMRKNEQVREPAFTYIVENEVKPGMVALDLGANIGYVTLMMAERVGSTGTVYAIEPDPRNYKVLTKNVTANGFSGFVTTEHLGGSNVTGSMKFYQSEHSNLGGMDKSDFTSRAVEVPVARMDDYFKDKKAPNFIKMDIEGHEVEVIDGMYETLKNAPSPVKILMEVHPKFYSKEHDFEVPLRRLAEMGFRSKYLITGGISRPDFLIKKGYEPYKVYKIDNTKLERGLYADVSTEDAIVAVCRKHKQYNKNFNIYVDAIVRAIMLEK